MLLSINKIIKSCAQCGEPFYSWPSQNRIYCSKECHNRSKGEPPQLMECEYCHEPFKRFLSQRKGPHRFCSRACAYKGREIPKHTLFKRGHDVPQDWRDAVRKRMTGGIPHNKGKPMPLAERLYKSKLALSNPNFPRGSKHRNWRGGRCRENHRRTSSLEWGLLRLEVLLRDDYTCRNCGVKDSTGEILIIHHLIPYRETQDDSKKNLVTLCRSCHAKIESPLQNAHEIKAELLVKML